MVVHTITLGDSAVLTEDEMGKYAEDLNRIILNTKGNLNRKDSIVLNCESETKMKALDMFNAALLYEDEDIARQLYPGTFDAVSYQAASTFVKGINRGNTLNTLRGFYAKASFTHKNKKLPQFGSLLRKAVWDGDQKKTKALLDLFDKLPSTTRDQVDADNLLESNQARLRHFEDTSEKTKHEAITKLLEQKFTQQPDEQPSLVGKLVKNSERLEGVLSRLKQSEDELERLSKTTERLTPPSAGPGKPKQWKRLPRFFKPNKPEDQKTPKGPQQKGP